MTISVTVTLHLGSELINCLDRQSMSGHLSEGLLQGDELCYTECMHVCTSTDVICCSIKVE